MVLSALALIPRKQAGLNPEASRDKYLKSTIGETQKAVFNALVRNHGELIKSLAWKACLAKWAIYALAAAALVAAAIVIIHPMH